jgi:uncharacterized protein (DUF2384 family)
VSGRGIPEDIQDVLFQIYTGPGAVLWWLAPNAAFDGRRPVDVATTDEGHQEVLDVLNRLADGNCS